MSVFDEMFDPVFFWDDEYKQRRDIQSLQRQILEAPEHGPQVRANAARIEQLELVCKALTELIVAKGVATTAELRVMMTQLDLADGVEDGRVSSAVKAKSPRCGRCQRFVNPKRSACVYCGTPMAQANPTPPAPPPRPKVDCSTCGKSVAENDTFFTANGLVCNACYAPQ